MYIDSGGVDCLYCENCESELINEAECHDRAAHEDVALSGQTTITNDTNKE